MASVSANIANLSVGQLCKIQSYNLKAENKATGALRHHSIYNAIFLGKMKHKQNTLIFYILSNKNLEDQIVYVSDYDMITCIYI